MSDELELEYLKKRLACIESVTDKDAQSNGRLVADRLLYPTSSDFHLSLIVLLNEPSDPQILLDEIMGADSMQEAKATLTQIKSRRTNYKRKALILQAVETWKNYT